MFIKVLDTVLDSYELAAIQYDPGNGHVVAYVGEPALPIYIADKVTDEVGRLIISEVYDALKRNEHKNDRI